MHILCHVFSKTKNTVFVKKDFVDLRPILPICVALFCSTFIKNYLRNDKTKIEEIGFLSDSVLNFLEFAVLVVTFLVVESIALDTANVEAKMWFILACFCLFVLDDIVLYKKIKK